ncbi:MAG: hypothetical protein ACXAAM_07570 [Candidatus Heimdallarchaeaceae archaeon]|jgi:hypothetical protein
MVNLREIKISKGVGVAILGTLMIGIVVGIAIEYYLLSNTATFNVNVQTGLPLSCAFTTKPAGNIYPDQWYNDSIVIDVTSSDDYQGYYIKYYINLSATGINPGDIVMVARVRGDNAGLWSSNFTLSFSTVDTDIIQATFLASEEYIAISGQPDDTLIAQMFFIVSSSAPSGQWDVDLWIEGYPE